MSSHRSDGETACFDEPDDDVSAGLALLEIRRSIAVGLGERCSDYAPGCPTCRAWRAFDDLAYLLDAELPPEGDER